MAVGGAEPLSSSEIAAPQRKKREVLIPIRMNTSFRFAEAMFTTSRQLISFHAGVYRKFTLVLMT
jgi:hypothetical protein